MTVTVICFLKVWLYIYLITVQIKFDVIRHDVSSSFPQVPLHMDGSLLTVF